MKRAVLVTGGTGVLGAALVAELCQSDFEVTANFWHDAERAAELQERTGCHLARLDVTNEASVQMLLTLRPFDAVVHCAGENRNSLLLQTSVQNWEAMLRSHLLSAFLVTQAALRILARETHLLLVASRVGERGGRGQASYAAAKAGVLGLMRSAALEGREREIFVNALCPGFAPASSSGAISSVMLASRASENELPDADATQSFASYVAWFLAHRPRLSGQVLRPDCRI